MKLTEEQIERVTAIFDNAQNDASGRPTNVDADAVLAIIAETVDPEQLTATLRGWGEQHTFRDSEAEDSFDRGIGNIFWALAVEQAVAKEPDDAES